MPSQITQAVSGAQVQALRSTARSAPAAHDTGRSSAPDSFQAVLAETPAKPSPDMEVSQDDDARAGQHAANEPTQSADPLDEPEEKAIASISHDLTPPEPDHQDADAAFGDHDAFIFHTHKQPAGMPISTPDETGANGKISTDRETAPSIRSAPGEMATSIAKLHLMQNRILPDAGHAPAAKIPLPPAPIDIAPTAGGSLPNGMAQTLSERAPPPPTFATAEGDRSDGAQIRREDFITRRHETHSAPLNVPTDNAATRPTGQAGQTDGSVNPPDLSNMLTDDSSLSEIRSTDALARDLPGSVSGAGKPPPNLLFQQPELPRHIAAQLAHSLRQAGAEKPVELILNPVELGRVRLSLQSGDGAMNVQVLAERPETLDLMRRNIDVLAQELHEIGYQTAEFAFGQNRSERNGDMTANSGDTDSISLDAPLAETTPATGGTILLSDRIDIRL